MDSMAIWSKNFMRFVHHDNRKNLQPMKFSCIISGCPEGEKKWYIHVFCHAFAQQKSPLSRRTEGELTSRYHLWFAAPSRRRPQGVESNPVRGIGRTRRSLLRNPFGPLLQDVFTPLPPPFSPARGSLPGMEALLVPFIASSGIIPGFLPFVNCKTACYRLRSLPGGHYPFLPVLAKYRGRNRAMPSLRHWIFSSDSTVSRPVRSREM